LVPPNLEYDYFAAAGVGRFDPTRQEFALSNATWLADAALLSYAEPSEAWRRFERGGLRRGAFFSGRTTQAYAAVADDFILVAFRGTELGSPLAFSADVFLADARFVARPWSGGGGVHHGFADALEEVWAASPSGADGLEAFLSAAAGDRPVWFTGHSLGAALATLAAARYTAGPRGLCTFASPRVGDQAFARSFPLSEASRFVHAHDAVPRLPPPELGFKHVGTPVFIDASGRISPSPGGLTGPGDTMHGRSLDLLGAIRLNFVDHAPIFYATHVWNGFAGEAVARV
jgi:pimeloyl-ACP methyl ester carboxylesterase